jgi:hypothetical protein
MSVIGGSIESVSINKRLFAVAADADANIDRGGKTAAYEPNGNGTARKILTTKVWTIDGISLEINPDNDDLAFLEETAASPDDVPITITTADGNTYQGKGSVTGDVKLSTKTATAPITLSGPGTLTLQ